MKNVYLTSRLSLCRAAKERFPKAAAFGALSWFVLCRAAKNEHLKPVQRTRAANFLFLWEEFCGAKFFVRGQTERPTKPVFYARASVKRRSSLKFSFLSFDRRTTRASKEAVA